MSHHILGSELDAALAERKRKQSETESPVWPIDGKNYRLRHFLVAGSQLEIARTVSEGGVADGMQDIVAGYKTVKSFFHPADADAAIDALVSAEIDMEYLEGMIKELAEFYANRPLASAVASTVSPQETGAELSALTQELTS